MKKMKLAVTIISTVATGATVQSYKRSRCYWAELARQRLQQHAAAVRERAYEPQQEERAR